MLIFERKKNFLGNFGEMGSPLRFSFVFRAKVILLEWLTRSTKNDNKMIKIALSN
jgi:hypothetical protein